MDSSGSRTATVPLGPTLADLTAPAWAWAAAAPVCLLAAPVRLLAAGGRSRGSTPGFAGLAAVPLVVGTPNAVAAPAFAAPSPIAALVLVVLVVA